MNRDKIMAQWDSWVKYYKAGGASSWPRDAFESLLDEFEQVYSRERLRIGISMQKGSGDTPGDIGNAAGRLYFTERECEREREKIGKQVIPNTHTAKLAEGEE